MNGRVYCGPRGALFAKGLHSARCWGVWVGLLFAATMPGWCGAQEDIADDRPLATVGADVAASVERGLKYLASVQNADGSMGQADETYAGNAAITALALQAWLADGSTPHRGPYGEEVARGVEYLLRHADAASGLIAVPETDERGSMYSHGFAMLALAQLDGESDEPGLDDAIENGVRLVVRTQNEQGGWRYYPRNDAADISVTITQVIALRAARNAGFFVPNATLDRATAYLRALQNAQDGGFAYRLPGGPDDATIRPTDRVSAFARSAAAVTALYHAGLDDDPATGRGLDYVARFRPGDGDDAALDYYYYGHYYATQAFWLAQSRQWPPWYAAVARDLVSRQDRTTGVWPSAISPIYATSMACITLQIPNHYLPILQR